MGTIKETDWGNEWRVDWQGDIELEYVDYLGNTREIYLKKSELEEMLNALNPPKDM